MKKTEEKEVLKKDKEIRLKSVVGKVAQIDWPDLSNEETSQVIELLRSFFGPHLKQLVTEAREKESDTSKSKGKKRVRINVKTVFPNLVFGINEVTKCMERSHISVFLVCRSDVNPGNLAQHLAVMSFVKKIPMVSLNNTATSFLAKFFSLPKLSVVGFKTVEGEDKLQKIAEQMIAIGKTHPVIIPWLDESSISILKPVVVHSVVSSKRPSAGKKQKQDNFNKKSKTEQNNNNNTQKKRKEQTQPEQSQKKQKQL